MKKSILATPLVVFVILAGCAKVRFPDYYVLNLPNPVFAPRVSGLISGSVAVREFRAPQYLRQGAIVYRPDSEQITFYNYHRWAVDPRQSVTAAIVLGLKQVFESAELYDGRTSAEFLLTGSLDHLEEVDNEHSVSVEVGISAKLQNVKTGNVLWSDTSVKTSEVNQRSLPAVVAEMSHDLSEAATQLVSSMRNRVPQSSFRANND
jgi:cholesterol transport system auxiliary component